MASQSSCLVERVKKAKTKLVDAITDNIDLVLIDAAERSLASDILSIKTSILLKWDSRYKFFLVDYYKNQGIHLVVTDLNLCFNLPSCAMTDVLNKPRRFAAKAFETESIIEMKVITQIVHARNVKIASLIKSLEDDLIKEIEGRFLFRTEHERGFTYSLEARFPNREKLERYCIGQTIQNHFIQNGFLCRIDQNSKGEPDNLVIIIPPDF